MSSSAYVAGISTDMGLFISLYIPCPGLGSLNSLFFSNGMMIGFSLCVWWRNGELACRDWGTTFLVNVVNITEVSHLWDCSGPKSGCLL